MSTSQQSRISHTKCIPTRRLTHIPEEKRALLEDLTGQLSRIPGMAAVVLGGSYASQTQHAGSDLDIGLYYHEAQPFSIADIRRTAESISADRAPTVTDFYEWGAWVNGGAWIHTAQGKVDFLYRSLEHVQRTIDEAQQGITHHDYNQQPPYRFLQRDLPGRDANLHPTVRSGRADRRAQAPGNRLPAKTEAADRSGHIVERRVHPAPRAGLCRPG